MANAKPKELCRWGSGTIGNTPLGVGKPACTLVQVCLSVQSHKLNFLSLSISLLFYPAKVVAPASAASAKSGSILEAKFGASLFLFGHSLQEREKMKSLPDPERDQTKCIEEPRIKC